MGSPTKLVVSASRRRDSSFLRCPYVDFQQKEWPRLRPVRPGCTSHLLSTRLLNIYGASFSLEHRTVSWGVSTERSSCLLTMKQQPQGTKKQLPADTWQIPPHPSDLSSQSTFPVGPMLSTPVKAITFLVPHSFFFGLELRTEPRAMHLLVKRSTTHIHILYYPSPSTSHVL